MCGDRAGGLPPQVPTPAELAAGTLAVGDTGLPHRKSRLREDRDFPSIASPLFLGTLFHGTGATPLLRGALDGVSGHSRWLCSCQRWPELTGGSGDPAPLVTSDGRPPPSTVCELLSVLVCVGWSLNKGLKIAMGLKRVAIEAKEDAHKSIGDGEGCQNITVAPRVKEKEQGNKPTFRRILKIFLEDGGKRSVQWVLERQDTEEAIKKCVAARPLTTVARVSTQVKHDGRLLRWVPRAQSQVQQGSSVQETVVETNGMKRNVGVQTEEDVNVILGDIRGAELAGKGEKRPKKGESVYRDVSCKGKAIMEVQEITNVTLRDPSNSGVIKCLEPETDSSSSEAEEGEFLDEASIISFFDNEEGLLIEQLEKEYEEQERDQKRRLDDGLEGVASPLEMGGSEGDMIAPSFSHGKQ
ncbi:uncharacterized protein G2W53_009510 [Senna tora]|uniref:Uncharacterized protein n=1 Tax=Senna tora TaxID=362788 RepID=A0A834WY68_9FABA|nr:uncharacterized protein G2W53_009510 [Senna tora]